MNIAMRVSPLCFQISCVLASPLASASGDVYVNVVGLTVTFSHHSLILHSLHNVVTLFSLGHVLYHASVPS